jgi:DNA-binding MarR family transcriptional regulator
MNSTMFSIKRAFLRTVNFGKKALAPFGLTPARFDALYLLWKREHRWQSQIWKILGLHPSTVSKLMNWLERHELVYRDRDPWNHREIVVKLAPWGRDALEAAMEEMVQGGGLRAYVAWAVAGPSRPWSRRHLAVLNLEEALLRVRRAFMDSARLLYVFDPGRWLEEVPHELPDWPRESERLVFD